MDDLWCLLLEGSDEFQMITFYVSSQVSENETSLKDKRFFQLVWVFEEKKENKIYKNL